MIIVQNLPVPLDRRVWLECQALVKAGYDVSVICPKGPGDPSRQTLDGVDIYKYRPAPPASGLLGYAEEFAYSWLRTAWLSLRVWRKRPFQVIQACNPPDTYWLLGRLWRRPGVRFVFDQHDLNPELFLSRFGKPRSVGKRLQLKALLWLERMTYRTADHVISTNESYKRIAVERGGVPATEVTVVRSGPDTQVMRPLYPDGQSTRTATHELVYLGIMGPQDGVDNILEVMRELVQRRHRTDVHATLLGFGDCLEDLRRAATQMSLDDAVTFTGRADKEMVADHLSAADIGLSPDPKNPLNDVSTMNKTMEYMAYALPSVSFDLVETRVSGEDTVLYVPSGDVAGFADAVERLLDDPDLRVDLGLRARARVAEHLDWRPQAEAYVGAYDALTGSTARRGAGPAPDELATPAADDRGRRLVDLTDPAELRRFVRERSAPALTTGRHRAAGATSSFPLPRTPGSPAGRPSTRQTERTGVKP